MIVKKSFVPKQRGRAVRLASLFFAIVLTGCGGVAVAPRPFFIGERIATKLDAARPCRVSSDGLLWYALSPGTFPPIVVSYLDCPVGGGSLSFAAEIPIPRWARAPVRTQTSFVAGTLQDAFSRGGSQAMDELARASGVPMTWMIGNLRSWRSNRDIYLRGRVRGDDIEIEPYDDLLALVRVSLPAFAPAVSIEGAGHERAIDTALRRGSGAFWGIAWNSSGVDATFDAGTPWGAYCADPASYKRPARDGRCALLGIEWTARDLTRAFWTGREDAYSTDPDDLQYRAGLAPAEAASYMRKVADAYAAAGEFRPLLVMAQEESGEMGDASGSRQILSALYAQARRDGMALTTLRQVAQARATIARLPRAIAFPYLPTYAPFRRTIEPLEPATIDYVDEHVAMTFAAGRTQPLRTFDYDRHTQSTFDHPVLKRDLLDEPSIVAVAQLPGEIVLRVVSPRAQHYAFAFWTDVDAAGVVSPAVIRAGHAGFVLPVNLPEGIADITLTMRRRAPSLLYAR